PDRLAHEIADVQQLDELVARRPELLSRNAVDRPVQLVRVERRQIPLQLVTVPHDERDPAQEGALTPRRDEAEHERLAAAWVQEAREHLQRRRLAGPVRPEEADDLARLDRERNLVDRTDLPRLAPDEALGGRYQAGFALRDIEDLEQAVDVYGLL